MDSNMMDDYTATGLAYRLQGWFGRTAQNLIAQGVISE